MALCHVRFIDAGSGLVLGVKDIFSKVSCFILSVKTFKERIESVNRQLAPLGIPYQFIFKHDVIDFASDPLPVSFRKPLVLTLPEQSIVGKHVEAWQQGLNSGQEYALVLEDDAILDPFFIQKLEKILSEIEALTLSFILRERCVAPVVTTIAADHNLTILAVKLFTIHADRVENHVTDQILINCQLLRDNIGDRNTVIINKNHFTSLDALSVSYSQ